MSRDRDWNLSITLAGDELRALEPLDSSHQNLRRPPHRLAEAFFEVAQASGTYGVRETVSRLAAACEDTLERDEPWRRFSDRNARLAEEIDSWRLISALCENDLGNTSSDTQDQDQESPDRSLRPKLLVQDYFKTDEEIRRMQLVVDWLESNAARRDASATCHPGSALHWENTLHHLQNGDSLFGDPGRGSGSNLISALDPDASRRQKKNLHALDRQDDDNLCRRIFKEIRCGRFEEAILLCVDSGQMWRAIVLQGRRLLDYPGEPQVDSKYPLTGNPSRNLWKNCCMEYLKSSEENVHFMAALGALSGLPSSVLPLCSENWDDSLWAHLRVQIEHRVDQYLREHYNATGAFEDEPVETSPEDAEECQELSMHQIFASVLALYRDKSETRYQEIQRYLILDEIDSALRTASSWTEDADDDLMRFLAHLVLILRQLGRDSCCDISDGILRVYVKKLIESTDSYSVTPELIAHYSVSLPLKLQISLYSELMWLVETKNERREVIEAGVRTGLDIQAAAVETVRYAIKLLKNNPDSAKNMSFGFESNEKNQRLIERITSSLEWLSFFDSQIVDAVSMSNCIIRILIFKGDVDSATTVLSRLGQFYPTSLIAQSLQSTSNILKEHLCLKAYLESINGYASWYRQHLGGRPKSPEPLLPECSFTDKVHYEQIKAQISLQQEQWAATGFHQAHHTKQLLYNVILFPQGWLVDNVTADEKLTSDDAEEFLDRNRQLLSLRKLCIPEIILLLLKVLQNGNVEGHTEAIRLSEILASENRKLYTLFSKHKLREVLHRIGESSLCVLENNRDPCGFIPSTN